MAADTMEAAENPDALALTSIWMLVAGSLVFFMQAGLLLVEAGFTRSKNTVNVLTKNFMDFCIGGLAYFFFGFGMMYGKDIAGFIGSDGFLLLGSTTTMSTKPSPGSSRWSSPRLPRRSSPALWPNAPRSPHISPTVSLSAPSFIPSAAIGYGVAVGWHRWASMTLPVPASSIWSVVSSRFTGAYLVGPRIGKFNKDGTANEFKPTNVPFIVLGRLILFFGWFGFNPGSTLNGSDLRMSVIAVNTFLAGCAAATLVIYAKLVQTGKADVVGGVNGALAGLVAITAPCAVVPPWAAVIIGFLAGITLMWGEKFVERTLKVDDAVGAVTVHGICGFLGVLMVGVFADGTYGVSGLIARQRQVSLSPS